MTSETSKSGAYRKVCLTCGKEFAEDVLLCPQDDELLTPIKADTLIGTVLSGSYEILEKLGAGGMGLVYKARHILMKRMVAIKIMLPQLIASVSALKRFKQEAQAASSLNHPNILTVYDFGVTPDGMPYLVMDFLEGTNLSKILEANQSLPMETAIDVFIQTCTGLSHAHRKGIVHRDLKPANIMLVEHEGRSNFVKIVDFGMAKIVGTMDGEGEDLTKSGEVFGSPLYMSPEQCMGKVLDARADVYSLGCVMYRVLTGVTAVSGATAIECFSNHVSGVLKPFAEVAPDAVYPPGLETIVFKAMAKDPADRYQSMDELKDALMEMSKLELSGLYAHMVSSGYAQKETVSVAGLAATMMADAAAPESALGMTKAAQAAATAAKAAAATAAAPPSGKLPLIPIAIVTGIIALGGIGYFVSQQNAPKSSDPAAVQSDDKEAGFEEIMKRGHAAFEHGDFEAALTHFEDALVKAKAKGSYEKQVPEAQIWIGKSCYELGQFDKAITACQAVLSARESSRQMTATDASEALNELGKIYLAKDNYKESKAYFEKALAIRKAYKGAEHDQVAESLFGLGNLALAQGQMTQATSLLTQALAIADASAAFDPVSKAYIESALGQSYQLTKKFGKARELYQKALDLREKSLSPDNPAIAESLLFLGTLEYSQRNLTTSETLLTRAAEIAARAPGKSRATLAEIQFCLAVLYDTKRDKTRALDMAQKSYDIRRNELGSSDPKTKDAQTLLNRLKGR